MKHWLAALGLVLGLGAGSYARADGSDYGQCAPEGVALGGLDLVSYFEPSGPVPGNPQLTARHGGLIYRFSDPAHLKRFVDDPDTYLPTYSGWCAATLSMGRLACPDFSNYKIENGELLLFEIAGFTNGRVMWDSDPVGHRTRADQHARTLLGQ